MAGSRPTRIVMRKNWAEEAMFDTTIAGSLPKPAWLAEPTACGAPWRVTGAELEGAKRDATLLALKLQEDCGIDVVTDGEQSRQHFVHGFVEFVHGIDFAHKVEIGIRADRYKALVPQVTGELRLKGRVHATEAQRARAHTGRKLKITLPGPMTIVDTVADAHFGDRVKMAMAFADLLDAEARALAADGVDVIQFDDEERAGVVEVRLGQRRPARRALVPGQPERSFQRALRLARGVAPQIGEAEGAQCLDLAALKWSARSSASTASSLRPSSR